MKRIRAFAVAGLVLAGAPAAADPGAPPVVVELFTSQGCYSCPPADRLLGELAGRDGILALSFHVDYWNYLGWRDPFSSKAATVRQRAYAWRMKRASVYTPQAVVDGRYQAIGSSRAAVEAHIRKARAKKAGGVEVALRRLADGRMRVAVTPGRGADADVANIYLVLFDRARTTDIPRGENAGKSLTYHHVVRDFRMIGDVAAEPFEKTVSVEIDGAPCYGAAVLVQQPRGGPIVGVAASLAHRPPGQTK